MQKLIWQQTIKQCGLTLFFKQSKPILIGCVCRPTDLLISIGPNFTDKLQEVLSLIPPHPDSIILRDTNVCLLHECCLLRKCLSLLNDNMLTKLICKPTRITDKTSTILYYTILYYSILYYCW